jgi:hypothetical protein
MECGLSSKMSNRMESQKDLIVDIPKERIRFFGGGGKMLLPSPATIGATKVICELNTLYTL